MLHNIRAKLLLPLLSPKAKSLASRVSARELDDVSTIKEFLLREFKLTHREYRACFSAATRALDETHILFVSRQKNLFFPFDTRSRECDSYDKLVDRLKDTLSLKYCLSIEGKQTLSASELASLADVFDVNYTPDGRYRDGTVTNFKDTSSAPPRGGGVYHGLLSRLRLHLQKYLGRGRLAKSNAGKARSVPTVCPCVA